MASGRLTWSYSTGSSAAIRTTSGCWPLLVFNYPRYDAGTRLVLAAQHLVFMLLGKQFRVFAHPPAKMLAVLQDAGSRQTLVHRRLTWQVAGLER
jgi:magnesium-protoporphyrin O-methyltransferase